MSASIVIRRAESRADKLEVTAVSREATRPSEPLNFYQALRFSTSKRRAAQWWLLEADGEPAASLVCYPLVFSPDPSSDARLPGFGLGAVATKTTHRHCGFATQLCDHVASHAAEQGREVGLLFSAIEPAFYERLGYRMAPAVDQYCDDVDSLARSGEAAALNAFDPLSDLDGLACSYRRAQAGLHLYRDTAAWRESVLDNPQHFFLTPSTPAEAYIRLAKDGESLEIVECASADASLSPAMFRAVAEMALGLGSRFVHTWLDVTDFTSRWFTDRGRASTLPMVRGVSDLASAGFSGADYF